MAKHVMEINWGTFGRPLQFVQDDLILECCGSWASSFKFKLAPEVKHNFLCRFSARYEGTFLDEFKRRYEVAN